MSPFRQILSLARPFWPLIFLNGFIIVIISLSNQVNPQVNKAIVDHLTTREPIRLLSISFTATSLLLFWLAVNLTTTILNRLSSFVARHYNVRFRHLLRELAYRNLLKLSIHFYNSRQSGKLMAQIGRGAEDVSRLMSNVGAYFIPNLFTAIVSAIIVFTVRWEIGLAALAIFFPVFFLRFRRQALIEAVDTKRHKIFDREYSHFQQAIASIRLIKSFAAENFELRLFKKTIRKIISLNDQSNRLENKFVFTNLLVEFWNWGILAYSVSLGLSGQITVGTVLLIIQYVHMIQQPLWNLDWIYWQAKDTLIAAKDYLAILNSRDYLPASDSPLPVTRLRGHLEFKDVWFKYPEKGGQDVFHGINFQVEPGTTIAIVGKSGVGKTTIAHLITRFFDPDKGAVLIDGRDIRDYSESDLRRNIGLVMQENYFFADTIAENLRYGKPTASLQEMETACQIANATEFINRFPKGLMTVIGERGVKLSGGQQQRLSIARTVLKNPPILILDEATSALDSHSELLVQDALWKLIKGRTTIIIAHRLSTVQKADQIIVLGKKTILEQGTHHELISNKRGIYASLHRIQSGQVQKLKDYDLTA